MLNYRIVQSITIYIGEVLLRNRIVQSITIYADEVLLRSGRHSLRSSWSHLSNRLDRNYE